MLGGYKCLTIAEHFFISWIFLDDKALFAPKGIEWNSKRPNPFFTTNTNEKGAIWLTLVTKADLLNIFWPQKRHFGHQKALFVPKGTQWGSKRAPFIVGKKILYFISKETPAHLFWPKIRYFSRFCHFNGPCGDQHCHNGVQRGQTFCYGKNDDRKTAIWPK